MILVDTSAWVAFLRNTSGPVCERVDELLDGETATCHPIRMEVLAGARTEEHLRRLRGLLARSVLLPTPDVDYEDAAALYRTCRGRGGTVRKLIDCLIAVHALREHIPILHADHDFSVIARHSALEVDPASSR